MTNDVRLEIGDPDGVGGTIDELLKQQTRAKKAIEYQKEVLAKTGDFARATIQQSHARLLGWLVAGNMAGLYFVIDRAAKRELPATVNFASLYATFLGGAVSSVAGLVFALVVGSLVQRMLLRLAAITDLATVDENVAQEALRRSVEMARLEAVSLAGNVFPFISGCLLLVGLASPLWLFAD